MCLPSLVYASSINTLLFFFFTVPFFHICTMNNNNKTTTVTTAIATTTKRKPSKIWESLIWRSWRAYASIVMASRGNSEQPRMAGIPNDVRFSFFFFRSSRCKKHCKVKLSLRCPSVLILCVWLWTTLSWCSDPFWSLPFFFVCFLHERCWKKQLYLDQLQLFETGWARNARQEFTRIPRLLCDLRACTGIHSRRLCII